MQQPNYGALAVLIGTILLFTFLVFALIRARKRRQLEMDQLERREQRDAPAPTPQLEEKRGLEALEAEPDRPKADLQLQKGLKKTQEGLLARLGSLFAGKEIPADLVSQVETILLTSDLGMKTTQKLLDKVKEQLSKQELKDQETLLKALEVEVRNVLAQTYRDEWTLKEAHPTVILMVGVNGVGKTTTIGKLASKFTAQGKKVLVAAGDTFRAAAADQLKVWAERAGADYYAGQAGKDPASVVFEAVQHGKTSGVDIILADTAGRLHTKTNLMEELKKVKRVISKVIPEAPHEVFLVVDATTGQNAVTQAREFNEALGLTGMVLTKLDGTAKGGVVVAIAAELNVPIRFIGVGETADDLRPFDAEQFAHALFQAA